MFDFEEDSVKTPKQLKIEDFDIELGIAMSKSIESGIISPEEIRERVHQKLQNLLFR